LPEDEIDDIEEPFRLAVQDMAEYIGLLQVVLQDDCHPIITISERHLKEQSTLTYGVIQIFRTISSEVGIFLNKNAPAYHSTD
jgi:hypothetical protein